jgi:hypothetical protein
MPVSEAAIRPCRSCRAFEAAIGCEAVVKTEVAVCQADRISRIHDCCAADRRLDSSYKGRTQARQLLQIALRIFLILMNFNS